MSAERRPQPQRRPNRSHFFSFVEETDYSSRQNQQHREPAAGSEAMVSDSECEVTLRCATAKYDVGVVIAVFEWLKDLADYHRDEFHTILDLSRGITPEGASEVIADFREEGMLEKDGSLLPVFRDVLESARRETKEGVILGNPFAPVNEKEAALIQSRLSMFEKRLGTLSWDLRHGWPPESDGYRR